MEFIKKMPATLGLAVINIAVFLWIYLEVGTTSGPEWHYALLEKGGLYNPLTLDGQWYRIFSSMFLHGSWLHLGLNIYGLFAVGQDIEGRVGTKKFILVYFLGGAAGALSSLYFNMFVLGVGASGAIFALFGFALVVDIRRSIEEGTSVAPVIVNFVVFLGINLLIATPLSGDNFAHLGGALCGAVFGVICFGFKKPATLIIAPLLIVIYFLLPRYQVEYFNFFQGIISIQDSLQVVLSNTSRPEDQFLEDYRRVNNRWDSTMNMLNAISYTPEELASDTFRLRRFIRYKKAMGNYRITMIERESYIYADSINIADDSVQKYRTLEHVLDIRYKPQQDTTADEPEGPPLETVRIFYDSNWVEIPYPPSVPTARQAAYYRIGQRDTAGRWQGPVADYYRNGRFQMKGSYKDDKQDGIFIFYNEKGGYSSAGIYNKNRRSGKWETFHPNGKLEMEIYYRDRYFLKSLWDSTGVQMVKDGNGREIHRYANGVTAIEGEYIDGYQEGYWYGRHENGAMYFEENYIHGRLINGRSRSKTGKTAVYDESSLLALPEGGFKKLDEYIRSKVKDPAGKGTVKLSFRVTPSGVLTDWTVEQSVSKKLDQLAKEIVLSGPRWLPAKLHGLEPANGFGFVSVEF
jgi:membrane associated rhomboid family serine protease/antitoxin component YwqK of YwqJK toxin-antitoxin module